ncbi:hypothetical protein GEMRC1_004970 [Eukaryota sp. GEM-RC1]
MLSVFVGGVVINYMFSPFAILLVTLCQGSYEDEWSCLDKFLKLTVFISVFSLLVGMTFGFAAAFTTFIVSFMIGRAFYMCFGYTKFHFLHSTSIIMFLIIMFSNSDLLILLAVCLMSILVFVCFDMEQSKTTRCQYCAHYDYLLPSIAIVAGTTWMIPEIMNRLATFDFFTSLHVLHVADWFFPLYKRL